MTCRTLIFTYFDAFSNELFPAVRKQFDLEAAGDLAEIEIHRAEVLRTAEQHEFITEELIVILNSFVNHNNSTYNQVMDGANEAAEGINRLSVALGVMALLIGVFTSIHIARSIKRPLVSMAEEAQLFAQGDFRNKVEFRAADEIGKLADSLNKMAKNLGQLINTVADNARSVAAHSEELAAS